MMDFKTLPLAGLLALVLCVAAPARAGSLLDGVFGHVQVDRRAALAQGAAAARPRRSDAGRPRHAAGTVLASWYGGAKGEKLGRRTASGEIFRPNALTCAHRSLPFGARLRVGFRGRSVVVRVTDRGPTPRTGRSLDLSRGAAALLGLTRVGVGRVSIERM
jgi:rare lipoprotein A (peptidoglycan hydrolase)